MGIDEHRIYLNQKTRAELAVILEDLGGRAGVRTRRAKLIDQILTLARSTGEYEGNDPLTGLASPSELVDALVEHYGEAEVLFLVETLAEIIVDPTRQWASGEWDVIANEVAARLDDRLPGVESYLEQYLGYPEFRIALAAWSQSITPAPEAEPHPEAQLIQSVIDALAALDRAAASSFLGELETAVPELASAVRQELPLEDDRAAQVWRVLDPRSPKSFRPADMSQTQVVETEPLTLAPTATVRTAVAERVDRTSSRATDAPGSKGRTLEEGLRDILATVFDLSQETGWKLRKQTSGTQFGFDIAFTAPGVRSRSLCLFECKDYTAPITLGTVADKLLQAELHWADAQIDHWILVSPRADPANDFDNALEQWSPMRWPFTVQVWSPSTGVKDLFRLDPEVYAAVYGAEPEQLAPEHHARIIAEFRRRIEPPLRIPAPFEDYARRGPILLPTDEASWPALLGRHIPRAALTEAGAPAASSLLAAASDWCLKNQRQASALLLLADFGEGKSFFTYELCAALLKKFRTDPIGSPLPLRFTLSAFRSASSPKEFLELQLAHYGGATVATLGELRTAASCVLILDGVDEMSVRQDGPAITDNLLKLQQLFQLVADVPIVLASRPHFFDSTVNRRRFYDRLRHPLVYRLGQPSRAERLDHLSDFAEATGTTAKLRRVKALYDPVGLSGKVLFLDMLKATLRNLPDDHFSEAVLYNTYISDALEWKIDLLDDPAASVSHEDLVESLKDLLNTVAVEIHQSDGGKVDLREFTGDHPNLAETLWRVAQPTDGADAAYDLSTDVAARVGMRSLLKRASGNADEDDKWEVEFSHRSLKEFFVARAVMTALRSPFGEADARQLLRELHLEPVILHFLGQLGRADPPAVLSRLRSLVGSATVGHDNGLLGGNALSCYVALGGVTRDESWDGLELDNAFLAGADLRESSFKRATLRWAVLDNADLTDSDLRYADLTGVRLEETSGVVSLSRGMTADDLLALYDDGSVRRWSMHEGGRSSYDTVISSLASGYNEVVTIDAGILLLFGPVGGAIWEASAERPWREIARFPSDNHLRRVAASGDTLAIVSEDDTGRLFLSAVSLDSAVTMWTTPCAAEAVAVSTTIVAGVGEDESVALFNASTGKVVARCAVEEIVMAMALREERTALQLGVATSNGHVFAFEVADGTCGSPAIGRDIHEALTTDASWLDVGLASGGGGRQIVVTRQSEDTLVAEAVLRRELRCAGARVTGLTGATERETLIRNGARE